MDNSRNIHSSLNVASVRKKRRFFDPIFNLISSLRLSSSSIRHGSLSHMNNGENNDKIRSAISRCRRSPVRNFDQHSSIELADNTSIKNIPLSSRSSTHCPAKQTSRCNHSTRHHSKNKRRKTIRRKRNHTSIFKPKHRSLSNQDKLPKGSLSSSHLDDRLTDVCLKVE